MKDHINQPTAIFSAAMLVALSTLLVNVSPVMVGAAAKHEIVPKDKLGLLIAPGLVAVFLISPFMLRWVRVINWKLLVAGGSLLSAIAYALAAQASNLTAMLTYFFFAGIGCGTLYSIGMCCLGDSKHPDRNFGIAAVTQTLTSAIMIYAIPAWVEPVWGFNGLMLVFSFLGAVSILFSFWFPARGNVISLPEVIPLPCSGDKNRSAILPWLALFALYLYFSGTSTLWTYFEVFAYGFNFSDDFVTNTLTASVFVGGLGAFVPVIIGSRFKRLWLILSTNSILLIIIQQLQYAGDETSFFSLSLGFYLFSSMALPFYFSAIASQDYGGKVVVLIPAVIAASAATGSIISGPLYVLSPTALVMATFVLVCCGLLMHMYADILTKRWGSDINQKKSTSEQTFEKSI